MNVEAKVKRRDHRKRRRKAGSEKWEVAQRGNELVIVFFMLSLSSIVVGFAGRRFYT